MFDFAWSEMALIAVVALIVIGPKDLPRVLRTVGIWVRKARAIAREFQGSIEDMVREVELDEVKRHVEQATRFNLEEEFTKTVDPEGELRRSLAEPVLANPLADAPPASAPAILQPAEALPLPAPAPEASGPQHAEPPKSSGGLA
ncbi:MAG TPA: Sec-independent protein translocase protein TatB [Stellaceae bacterium]|nr:Sec-independent protein translocase protein TatB [Stellaceae bacterium]